MKRIFSLSFVLGLFTLATALPTFAQDSTRVNEVVTLDDTTPSIDVVITLPQDTTGAVSVNVQDASVKLTDWAGNTVFYEADPRIHAVELNIAPNTGSHTLTVERLPEVAQAFVRVNGLAEISTTGTAEFVQIDSVSLNQERALPLTTAIPGGSVLISIPSESRTGVITANYAGIKGTSQLVDAAGAVIATAYSDIDSMNIYIDSGDYLLTLVAEQLPGGESVAGIRAMPVENSDFTLLAVPANVNTQVNHEAQVVATGSDCTATIAASSVNLRSGPGTGYSILNYGYLNDTFPVGGINPEGNWVVIGTEDGNSAWIARSATFLDGTCSGLTTYNIPLREAQPAEVVIQTIPAPITSFSISGSSSAGGGGDERDHEDEHDDDDHDEHEGGDHDDD